MSLTRQDVYNIIDVERLYQDTTYDADEQLPSGVTRRTRDLDVTSHLVLLDEYVAKAKTAWLTKGDNRPSLKQIAKVAAIAVRALERAGGAEALLSEGLR